MLGDSLRPREGNIMENITDEDMLSLLPTTKPYTIVVLKKGSEFDRQSPLIWEHGRRNFSLRADGRLAIVCPVDDGKDVTGVGIFNLDEHQTRDLMDEDPCVRAGIFMYETHPTRSFSGDALPADPWRAKM